MTARGGESTCWSLILGAAEGDHDDRDSFARRYEPVLATYLAARWRVPRDHDDVRDGIQEIFFQCFRNGGALGRADSTRPGGFRAFLYGIARNIASELEQRRRRTSARTPIDSSADLESQHDSLSRVFDGAFARMLTAETRTLLAARAKASDAAKRRLEALDLCYTGALPSREIALSMGLAVEQVYPLLTAARKEFKAAFLEVLAFYHPKASRAELEQSAAEILVSLSPA